VSFVAGLLIDKFAYHLPLYRQHQRLSDAGITVSRPWLTQIAQQGTALLAPIYEAQFDPTLTLASDISAESGARQGFPGGARNRCVSRA